MHDDRRQLLLGGRRPMVSLGIENEPPPLGLAGGFHIVGCKTGERVEARLRLAGNPERIEVVNGAIEESAPSAGCLGVLAVRIEHEGGPFAGQQVRDDDRQPLFRCASSAIIVWSFINSVSSATRAVTLGRAGTEAGSTSRFSPSEIEPPRTSLTRMRVIDA